MTLARPQITASAQRSRHRQTVHCYRVTRRDGTIVRTTDCSEQVWLGSELFLPGADRGNDVRQSGLTERNLVVRGVEQTGAITFADLISGQIGPGCSVVQFRFDRRMPFEAQETRCVLQEAPFDTEGGFSLEIVTDAKARLLEQRGDVTTRDCRNQFGDAQCAGPLLTDGTGALVLDEWTVGIGVGPFPTVTAVTSQVEIRVAIPRIAITAATTGIDLSGRDFVEFTTAGNHYLGGLVPNLLNTDPLRLSYGIRGQSGGTPNLNGNRLGSTAYASSATKVRVLVETTVVPSTLGYIGFEPVAGWLDRGVAAWRSGPNVGIPTRIRSSTGFIEDAGGSFGGYIDLVLATELANPIQVGQILSLVTGCTGTRPVCAGKFGRVAVFRGEPTIGTAEDLASVPAQR